MHDLGIKRSRSIDAVTLKLSYSEVILWFNFQKCASVNELYILFVDHKMSLMQGDTVET